MNRHFSTFKLLILFLALISGSTAHALTNGLALTPPMGWNSWYGHAEFIDENLIKSTADQMATNCMKDAGYTYVCIDDGWAGYRDTNGVMVSDTNTFPSGIKALADYVHARGLKLGLYTVFGPTTCAGRPGSFGHVVQDANTFAAWGVDYVKYEGCSFPDPVAHEQEQCDLMGNALLATGRPIVYTMSTGPTESWFTNSLNCWRGTGDNSPSIESVMGHLDFVSTTPSLAGPGHWNDPDVLEVGFMPRAQGIANMSLWSIVAAPLLTATFPSDSLDILTNSEVIAVDQDPAGIQGTCVVTTNGNLQTWCKPLGSQNSPIKAMVFFNRSTNATNMTVNWTDLGLSQGTAMVRDLWAKADFGFFTNSFTTNVPARGVQMLKITYGARVLPTVGTNYLSDMQWLATINNPFPLQWDKDTAGLPITIHGVVYPKGMGAHAISHIDYFLGGIATRFKTDVGVDDDACCGRASLVFRVSVDGTNLYDSGVMTSSSPAQTIDVDVTGGKILSLDVTDAGDGAINDHADWAGSRLVVPPRQPSIGALTFNSSKMLINGASGAPGNVCYLLTATNLALPLPQWTRIATNQFDGTGNLTFTNTVNPTAAAMFYRLQLP